MKVNVNDRVFTGKNYKTIIEQIDQYVRKMFAGSYNPVLVRGPCSRWSAILYRTPNGWWYRLINNADDPLVDDGLSANSARSRDEGIAKIKYHIAQLVWGDGLITTQQAEEYLADTPTALDEFRDYVRMMIRVTKEAIQ